MAEKDYYEPVKKAFEKLFNQRGQTHLEITSDRSISNQLKSKIHSSKNIIFYFLKEAKPDISGFIKREAHSDQFIVIEIKNEPIKLDHIYQTRKYGELFDAQFVFLVSTEEIPQEIKNLSSVVYSLLSLPAYRKLILCQFNENTNEIIDWYEKNPFEEEYNWR